MNTLYEAQEPFLIAYFFFVSLLLFMGGCYLLRWLFDKIEGWWIRKNQKGMIGRTLL